MSSIRMIGLIPLALLVACASQQGSHPAAPAGPVVLNASSKADIDSALPKPAVIAGVVDNVQTGERITINFKNTQDSQFYAIALNANVVAAMAKQYNGDVPKALTGKAVHVTGNVVLYRNRPEVVINSADQLTVDPGQ